MPAQVSSTVPRRASFSRHPFWMGAWPTWPIDCELCVGSISLAHVGRAITGLLLLTCYAAQYCASFPSCSLPFLPPAWSWPYSHATGVRYQDSRRRFAWGHMPTSMPLQVRYIPPSSPFIFPSIQVRARIPSPPCSNIISSLPPSGIGHPHPFISREAAAATAQPTQDFQRQSKSKTEKKHQELQMMTMMLKRRSVRLLCHSFHLNRVEWQGEAQRFCFPTFQS